jgi:gamma-glutamylcyclotransferase (GGCT)/AIG2-like uncharacterized protein YtfP
VIRLFVYGTLKRGFSNAPELRDAAYEGPATAPGYALYVLSGYPAMTSSADGAVRGELYSVSRALLKTLDDFEEVPDRYRRETIKLDDGTFADAYLVPPDRVRGLVSVPGGEFVELGRDRNA